MKNTLLVSVVAVSLVGVGYLAMNSNNSVRPSYEERTQLTFNQKSQSWSHAQQFQKMFRANVITGEIDPGDVLRAREQADFLRGQRGSVGLEWAERGPDNVGGRTRAILIDKLDTTGNTVFAGSVSGGLFKSENGGATWSPIDDHSLAPAISCIDQGTNGTIYVGTGCSFESFSGNGSSGMIGMGMYKSTDGITFTLLSSTIPSPTNSTGSDWTQINAVAVDPTDDNRVFAATKQGLMLSTDGGSTWTCAATNVVGICVGGIQDVKIADDGTVMIVQSGNVMISADGSVGSFNIATGTEAPGGNRTVIQYAPSDNNIAWALSQSGGELRGLYRSTDKGYTWSLAQGPVTNIWDQNSGLFNGQANYDLALGVNPLDASVAYVGGVQLWRYDGALTRIANEFGQTEFNVHSDKHVITFDPHNPNKMFIGSDGGVTLSYDAGGTYFPASKGYTTTTFYAVAFDNDGKMMAGAQDNGTVEVTREILNPGLSTGLEGEDVRGGDGYYCDYSQITNIRFATIYSQDFARGIDGAATGRICNGGNPGPACDQGSFCTVGRLWESANDPTSQDSIVFDNTNPPQAILQGDGVVKGYDFDIAFVQSVAQLVPTSVKVYAGSQLLEVLTLSGDTGKFSGDGSGYVLYAGAKKGHIEVLFDDPPSATETVWVEFETKFNAGDELDLISNTNFLQIPYTLPMNINPGDVLKVVDPIQSIFAAAMVGGVSITRNSLKLDLTASDLGWIDIPVAGGSAGGSEFTPDGNHLFIGYGYSSGGTMYRISGLNDVYSAADVANLTVTNLGTFGGSISGIAIDPNNPDNVVITTGNYGRTDYVWRCTNALTASGSSSFTSIQGNLPELPCYDAEIMIDRPGFCVIGTEMGVYATADLFANPVVWSDENGTMAHTQVHAVRQQTLGYGASNGNRGQIYLGTHGRGMWESTAGTGIGEFSDGGFSGNQEQVSDLKVYPNPMSTSGVLSFELTKDGQATIQIFDMTGKLVKSITKTSYQEGTNNVEFDVAQLRQGTYFVTVESNDSRKVAKFVVM
ncbi:MAG: T9SS type A sorting domain-containing protein [Flavobacteriales bacterium]|nr:T9SS type A sorting domain-containing protein [Flavobacteriales bacterium]